MWDGSQLALLPTSGSACEEPPRAWASLCIARGKVVCGQA
jgi:hypothetical protein